MRARVIGLGAHALGDDGVGLVVAGELARQALADVEVFLARDGAALIPLLATPLPVVLVDALVVAGEPFGEVRLLGVDAVAPAAAASMSSHGLGVREALALAQALDPEGTTAAVHLVAITIPRPPRYAEGLGPEASAAVPKAIEAVLTLVRSFPDA